MGNTRQLPQDVIASVSTRLASLGDLRLPAQLARGGEAVRQAKVVDYLTSLLLHDPGVFLERHGSSLTEDERRQFECLRGDYEVDFYLKLLEDQQDAGKQGALAKNRRLAAMHRLDAEGYFGEKEMRDRQPGLYHQYIGQYRPPEAPQAEECQAGAILASSIMRQQEELDLRQRQAAEQQRWDQQESEEESEEEEAAGEGQAAGQRGAGAAAVAAAQQHRQQQGDRGAGAAAAQEGPGEGAEEEEDGSGGADYIRISEEEQQDNAAAFLDAMRQRFLSGQDAGVDYAAIDADAELDEDWAKQANQDAQDKYFDSE